MNDNWLRDFVGPCSLHTLVAELETLAWKKDQMDPTIARNKKFKLPIREEPGQHRGGYGGYLTAEHTQLEE